MTALLIFGIVALALFSVLGVAFAVAIRQGARDASLERTRASQRHEREMTALLNRLMAIRWEDFITIEETQTAEEGGFFPPGDETEEETQVIPRWGSLGSRSEEFAQHEDQLLMEDFPEAKDEK